jgi:mono/diheme cytochrome c family protein
MGNQRQLVFASLRRAVPLLALATALICRQGADGAESSAEAGPSGSELYRAACMACHGEDGSGQPRATVGFDLGLPDFTDCSFASREPVADWVAVAHDGGPARGFSPLMPAFGEALSPDELERTVEYVHGFCEEAQRWPRGDLNMPRAFHTTKAFPEDEAVVSTSVATGNDHQVQTKFTYETRVGSRGQVEFILPFSVLQTAPGTSDWTGGIGDLVLATKWVLVHSPRTGSIVSAGLETIMPTGRADRGLGKETWLLEPFLAYGQLLPLDSFIQLHVGAEASTEPDKVGHEAFWRLATGMSFSQNRGFGRAWTPMVEILGSTELEGGATPSWGAVPQMQVSLPTRQHILLCIGVSIPISDFDRENVAALVYVLWDWFDGPLTEGW